MAQVWFTLSILKLVETCVSSQQASGLSDEKVKDKPSRKRKQTSGLSDDVSLITLQSRALSRTQSRTK